MIKLQIIEQECLRCKTRDSFDNRNCLDLCCLHDDMMAFYHVQGDELLQYNPKS